MKRVLLCLVAIIGLSVSSLSAQQKGDWNIGGNLGIGLSSVALGGESATAVEFGLGVDIGCFVADRFRLGLGLAYDLTGGDDAVHAIVVGPALSYYIPICDSLFYAPRLDLAFACGISGGESIPGFALGLSIANFEYRPTDHIGLSASLLSFSYSLLSKYNISTHTVNLGLSLSPTVGVSYYF